MKNLKEYLLNESSQYNAKYWTRRLEIEQEDDDFAGWVVLKELDSKITKDIELVAKKFNLTVMPLYIDANKVKVEDFECENKKDAKYLQWLRKIEDSENPVLVLLGVDKGVDAEVQKAIAKSLGTKYLKNYGEIKNLKSLWVFAKDESYVSVLKNEL